MGDVVVTRADRECALDASGWGNWRGRENLERWATDGGDEMLWSDGKTATPMTRENIDAKRFARVRIAAERACYERGVREERERVAKYVAWAQGYEAGLSSACLLLNLAGIGSGVRVSTPHDCGDFGRCLTMLERFPEMRERLPEAAQISPAWSNIVHGWVELEGFCNAAGANKLYALLTVYTSCELIESQRHTGVERATRSLERSLEVAKTAAQKKRALDDAAWWAVRKTKLGELAEEGT